VLPPIHIARLVATGKEDGFSLMDDFGDLWISRGLTAGNNERSHGIGVAKLVDVVVVIVVAGRA